MRRAFAAIAVIASVLAAAGAGAFSAARGQEPATDADDAAHLRGEVLALRRELKDVKARLAHLEQMVASIAAAASAADTTRPELNGDLGFVVPNLPRGTDYGCESPSELARFLHHYATSGEHDIEKLVAFKGIDFYVPEALWNASAKGLKSVQGLPTRDELELALAALKTAGTGSQLMGIRPANDLVPAKSASCIQVHDLDVGVDGRTDRYRLTAVKLRGRWFAAHLLAVAAEEDARAFLDDLVASQRSFHAFRQQKYYAQNLHELAGAREQVENSIRGIPALSFPLGARLDRLEKDKLDWVGNDLRGPFYRFTLSGDEKSGWSAVAIPRSPSYWSFSVSVTAGGDQKPVVKRFRAATSGDAPSNPKDESKRREGTPDGD